MSTSKISYDTNGKHDVFLSFNDIIKLLRNVSLSFLDFHVDSKIFMLMLSSKFSYNSNGNLEFIIKFSIDVII